MDALFWHFYHVFYKTISPILEKNYLTKSSLLYITQKWNMVRFDHALLSSKSRLAPPQKDSLYSAPANNSTLIFTQPDTHIASHFSHLWTTGSR